MEVRKFEAFSMNDAIKLVKKELGKDAVILQTREKDTLAMEDGRPIRVVEVVAAAASSLGPDDAKRIAARAQSASQISSGAGARPVEFPRIRTTSDMIVVKGSPTLGVLSTQTKLAALGANAARAGAPLSPERRAQADARERLLADPRLGPMAQMSNSASAAASAAATAASAAAQQEDVREMREELGRVRRDLESLPQVNVGEQMQEIKVLLHDLMRNRAQTEEGRHHEYLADIGVRLRAAGVRESVTTEALQTVSGVEIPREPGGTFLAGAKLREFFLSQTIKVLFRQLGVTGHWRLDPQRSSLICLVGPTGVGKTTTLAKLAARLKLTDGRPVALASMDTFRIGGSDQLRTYGKILDCPFAEISEPHELVDFVSRLSSNHIVLVDTAGRNARHQAQMESLRKLTGLEVPLAFHLVLSATMKQRDLDENVKAYRILDPESLLFTKLDESWSYGEILNCSVGSRTPISYFTTGQKVPEDLEPATKERVVERLFRL